MAHATDGGGSIRIPASCCGLFGLKPTRGRISMGPESGEALAGLAHQHAVTISVRDSAALLDAISGPMPGDPYFAPPPAGPFLAEVGRSPGRLRIAFTTKAPNGVPIDAACAAAVEETARLCIDLGHDVEEAAPAFDLEETEAAYRAILCVNTMANIARATGGGLPEGDLIEPLTRAMAERGLAMPAFAYVHHLQHLHRQARRIARLFDTYDVWLTPTLATPPQPLGFLDTGTTDVDGWMAKFLAFTPFCYLCNVTGQPAMSVPLGESADGLPIGCHFAGRYGREDVLFRLAGQLETARPWAQRRPRLAVKY
jgi:Asp-tRNA(Asn)/Glu-tRNA(Gln) amidotransferase A subunit family amidase